jgi:hypothetical protein
MSSGMKHQVSSLLEWAPDRHLLNRRTVREEYLKPWLPLDYEINRASGTIRFQSGRIDHICDIATLIQFHPAYLV